MLHVHEISKKYGHKTILQQVSFHIKKGEIVGLVGENGAGKSTLLHILASMIKQTSGHFTVDGESNAHPARIREKIGFVPQDIALWGDFTVKENMVFFEKLSWKKKSISQLKQLCEAMHLHVWDRPVASLSGGMKRKLNIAISLIHDPPILFLDEPTVGIDLKSKQEIATYLTNLATNDHKTILYISHDMDEIMTMCNRVISIGEDPFYEKILAERGMEVTSIPTH